MSSINQMKRDASASAVQVGTTFVTHDASDTPKTSPFTLTGGVDIFIVPEGCYEFIVNPVAHDLNISEISTGTPYDVVTATTKEAIGCARMTAIYVQGTVGDNLNFRFTSLG